MVLVFSLQEKNNKYKLLDENAAHKIELIKVHDDKNHETSESSINDNDKNHKTSKPSINDNDEITEKANEDENKVKIVGRDEFIIEIEDDLPLLTISV